MFEAMRKLTRCLCSSHSLFIFGWAIYIFLLPWSLIQVYQYTCHQKPANWGGAKCIIESCSFVVNITVYTVLWGNHSVWSDVTLALMKLSLHYIGFFINTKHFQLVILSFCIFSPFAFYEDILYSLKHHDFLMPSVRVLLSVTPSYHPPTEFFMVFSQPITKHILKGPLQFFCFFVVLHLHKTWIFVLLHLIPALYSFQKNMVVL